MSKILLRFTYAIRGVPKIWILTLALSVFTVFPVLAEGNSITTAMGFGADAFVESNNYNNNADNNYGSEYVVAIKHDTDFIGYNRKGYLRFDLSSLTSPIPGAKLNLVYAGGSTGITTTYNIYGLNDGNPGENWNESTITWNNAPGNDSGSSGGVNDVATTYLGSFNFSSVALYPGDTVSFVSPEIVSFLRSDTNHLVTFIITRQQQNWDNQFFASKEYPEFSPPTLEIIPEPSTFLLFAAALPGLIVLRKKRGTRIPV